MIVLRQLWFLILCVLLGVFAPSRADARLAETRTWVFAQEVAETRLETEPQAVGKHQENGLWNYEHAPGCTQAAERTAGALGRQGEAAIQSATGLAKNTQSFVVNGRTRIPDFIRASDPATGLPTSVIESKNVQYQSLTRQLRDYRDLVGAGGRVDVALPPGARVSRPLQEAFDTPTNPLFRMDLP